MTFDITPYTDRKPLEVRQLTWEGKTDFPTAEMCRGYVQASLVILPGGYAADFERYTEKNPFTCPTLEIVKGSPETHTTGEGRSIRSDVSRYWVYENGVVAKGLADVSSYWKEGYMGFLIGCSFSLEEALIAAGVPVRHIEMRQNILMFKINIQTEKVGPSAGLVVCSMRPMTPEQAKKAYDITVKIPNIHGTPVQTGGPEKVDVRDTMKPDHGDMVEIREGEIPVF